MERSSEEEKVSGKTADEVEGRIKSGRKGLGLTEEKVMDRT